MTFTILCDNHNPIPYKRTTQKQKYVDKDYKKYLRWKSKVMADFIKTFKIQPHKVFLPKKKYYVHIVAYYKDFTHGDTDNVAKGINDAIFQKPLNDKYISGSYDYFYDKEKPRVEVRFTEEDI